MEFTQAEKDRVLAEEKLRYETFKDLQLLWGGKFCPFHSFGPGPYGGCQCRSLIKGFLLGVVFASLLFFLFARQGFARDGGRVNYNGSPVMQSHGSPSQAM